MDIVVSTNGSNSIFEYDPCDNACRLLPLLFEVSSGMIKKVVERFRSGTASRTEQASLKVSQQILNDLCEFTNARRYH